MTSSSSSPPTDPVALADRGLRVAEQVVYLLACVLLLGGAVVLLVKAGYDLVMLRGDDGAAIEIGVLSALLLVLAVALFLLRREEREPEEA